MKLMLASVDGQPVTDADTGQLVLANDAARGQPVAANLRSQLPDLCQLIQELLFQDEAWRELPLLILRYLKDGKSEKDLAATCVAIHAWDDSRFDGDPRIGICMTFLQK